VKKLILFVNSGRTDLQVLIQENGECYRVETAKENLRAFHQALLDSKNGKNGGQSYHISDNSVKKHRNYDAIWENEQLHLKKRRENTTETKIATIVTDEQGSIQLVSAKLLRVVENLKKDYQVIKAVVFYTHRENDRKEPIAVGEILADWLKDYFSLTTDDVSYVNILQNRNRIESPDERDYPVNRDTVKIIDRTVRKLAKSADKNCIACVSAAGMQDVKNLIKACVRFHFNPWQERFMEMEVKEREDKAVKINQIPTAVNSFHAREHAIALIQQGDFSGAYGAVKHLEKDSDEKVWVKKVADVSAYFGGQLEYREDLPDYLKYFAKRESPRCLLVAMRTEAALLSGRIADAISLTCTFFDAAMLDAIEQNQPIYPINEIELRIIYKSGNTPDPKLNSSKCLNNNKFREEDHYRYAPIMGNRIKIWLEVMGENVKYLQIYRDTLDEEISIDGLEKQKPKNLRNINTHSLLKSGQLEMAKQLFVKAGFWKIDTKPFAGSGFLAQPLVNNVLKKLKQDNVSQRYSQLIEGVCGELANVYAL
jgi:disulfide oxidoreductase YuzD